MREIEAVRYRLNTGMGRVVRWAVRSVLVRLMAQWSLRIMKLASATALVLCSLGCLNAQAGIFDSIEKAVDKVSCKAPLPSPIPGLPMRPEWQREAQQKVQTTVRSAQERMASANRSAPSFERDARRVPAVREADERFNVWMRSKERPAEARFRTNDERINQTLNARTPAVAGQHPFNPLESAHRPIPEAAKPAVRKHAPSFVSDKSGVPEPLVREGVAYRLGEEGKSKDSVLWESAKAPKKRPSQAQPTSPRSDQPIAPARR